MIIINYANGETENMDILNAFEFKDNRQTVAILSKGEIVEGKDGMSKIYVILLEGANNNYTIQPMSPEIWEKTKKIMSRIVNDNNKIEGIVSRVEDIENVTINSSNSKSETSIKELAVTKSLIDDKSLQNQTNIEKEPKISEYTEKLENPVQSFNSIPNNIIDPYNMSENNNIIDPLSSPDFSMAKNDNISVQTEELPPIGSSNINSVQDVPKQEFESQLLPNNDVTVSNNDETVSVKEPEPEFDLPFVSATDTLVENPVKVAPIESLNGWPEKNNASASVASVANDYNNATTSVKGNLTESDIVNIKQLIDEVLGKALKDIIQREVDNELANNSRRLN